MDFSTMDDETLAEEYKSLYLQVKNQLPQQQQQVKNLRKAREEIDNRDLEILQSVRVLNSDEEVLCE